MDRDRPQQPKLSEPTSPQPSSEDSRGRGTQESDSSQLPFNESGDRVKGAEGEASEALAEPAALVSSTPPEGTLAGIGPVDTLTHMARMRGVLAPGSSFGVYVVEECIGEGGMARIYRAEHAGLRRQVALKVLINGFAKDAEGRERFVREARIAAAIKHPNVVNIFDVGVHAEIPYLVMELLTGTDLESMVQTKGALEESLVVDIMVPVVAGLSAVHDAGIVHRDLKPGNIFLSRGRYEEIEPKLLDFGISKVSGPDQLKITTNGLLMGTPFYMSPEGLRGDEMTPLSDQYSLAVVMYECATGHTPFMASTFPELIKLIAAGQCTPPTVHNPEISKRLARIIMRAMSLEPERRFKDLREMGRELLLLAGQRTRITWGLTFGDLQAPTQTATHTATKPSSIAPVSASVSPRPFERWRKPAALSAALIPILGLIVFAVLAGGKTEEAGAPLAPVAVTPRSQAAVADPSPAQEKAATPSLAEQKRSSPSSAEEQGSSPRADVASPPSASERTANRTSARALVPGARLPKSAMDPEPEWALPSTNSVPVHSKTGDSRPASGANGAPIFD